jgi:hypothetical protein
MSVQYRGKESEERGTTAQKWYKEIATIPYR